MWTDAYFSLIDLNLLILVTTEIKSKLLGLVCWRFINCYLQLLCLAIRGLWTKRIESRNRFRDSNEFV